MVYTATPLATSPWPTKSGTAAALAGIGVENATPLMKPRTKTCHGSVLPVKSRIASASRLRQVVISPAMRMVFRFSRSAITPPMGVTTIIGVIDTAWAAVTMKGESVISRTSQPRPAMFMKKGMTEKMEAAHSSRNCG